MPKNLDSTIDMADILIVDDESTNLQLLSELLGTEGYQVRPADSPQLAIDSALGQPPGLILLDVKMPEMDGFEVCRRLKQDKQTRDIPIIFVSALHDVEDKVRGFEAGGVDFISKPFQEQEVLARVRAHMDLRNMQLNLEEMVAKRTAEIIEREERFRATFEQAAVGVVHVSLEGRFLRTNQKFCDIVGYSEEEMLALTFQDIIHPEDLDADLKYHRQVLAGEIENYSMDKRYYRKDGSIVWVNLTVSMLFDTGGRPKYFIAVVNDISDRKQAEIKLADAFAKIEKLQKQLQAESAYLQEEIKLEHNFENIIGNSNAIQYTLFKVEQVAETDATVLILGETGTGKELIARAIHHHSQRKDRPLIKLNCATLPANLIESELFGHEKGSFTGAADKHRGRFEVADGSSLFLDEIGELPLELQAKLLRVLEEGEFERLGSTKTRKVDVRIIAATNRDLKKDVNEGKFREDLWYRLNVFPITLPPLRDRIEDIPLIVQYCVNTFSRKLGKDIVSVPKEAMKTLQNYPWPGNVRELQNVLERSVIGTSGPSLQLSEALNQGNIKQPEGFKSLHDMERDYIISILEKTSWKVSGKNSAAEILGLERGTLRARMNKLGIHKNST